jgi:hypothetical protein
MQSQLDGRLFMGAAGTSLLVLLGRSGRAAASERVRVAVIGLRNRGTDLARLFASNPGSQVAAVCDVDDAMFMKPVDAGHESFHDNQADLPLSREYSKRFEMPSHV